MWSMLPPPPADARQASAYRPWPAVEVRLVALRIVMVFSCVTVRFESGETFHCFAQLEMVESCQHAGYHWLQ